MIFFYQLGQGPVLVTAPDVGPPSSTGNRKALENSDISQAWFTTRDEKDALHSKGDRITSIEFFFFFCMH